MGTYQIMGPGKVVADGKVLVTSRTGGVVELDDKLAAGGANLRRLNAEPDYPGDPTRVVLSANSGAASTDSPDVQAAEHANEGQQEQEQSDEPSGEPEQSDEAAEGSEQADPNPEPEPEASPKPRNRRRSGDG
jgi:hypothetical protein